MSLDSLDKEKLLLELKRLELELQDTLVDSNLTYILFTFLSKNNFAKVKKVLSEIDKGYNWFLLPIVKNEYELTFALLELLSTLNKYKDIDFLTTLYNKRFFEETLIRELEESKKFNVPLGIVVFDVDDFKKINDTYGHRAGDIVLKEIGKIFKNKLRSNDFACRIGGEEFGLILRGANMSYVHKVSTRILNTVGAHKFVLDNGKILKVTISGGGVVYAGRGEVDKNTLFEIADKNLYKAKRDGKNRCYISFYYEEKAMQETLISESERNILFNKR
ncbi:MAG: GGDEF domain-containing protein [Desulfonauticus sp.]|nr:GGDEF domain-containing protein [Desulfonauticus sp.]